MKAIVGFMSVRRLPTAKYIRYFNTRQLSTKSPAEVLLEESVSSDPKQDRANNWLHGPYPKGTSFKQSQAYRSLRPTANPEDTSIILFPGQGTQYVGMGENLLKFPNVRHLYDNASEILGYDLLKLCLKGPISELSRTEYCQAAILVHSLACVEKLKIVSPSGVDNCITSAGFSVGEITALTFAGCFTFEDAVKLVQVRGLAMQKASQDVPSGMMTVFYKPSAKVGLACEIAKHWCIKEKKIQGAECCVANYMFPGCKVIAGNEEALEFLEENKDEFHFKKCKRLPVSGAFHTNLMKSAAAPVIELLEAIEISDPIIPVHSNIKNHIYKSAKDVKSLLPKQIYSPVRWEQLMHVIYERNPGQSFPNTFECGPGKSLSSILKYVNAKAFVSMKSIDS